MENKKRSIFGREAVNKTADDMYDLESESEDSSDFETVIDEKNGRRIRVLPGETKEEAVARDKRDREHRRLLKFMQFAYPRQREAYLYKKKMLDPDQMNTSVDLTMLKREFRRMEKERQTLKVSNTNADT